MATATLLNRYFGVVALALVAIAAYSGATGLAELLGMALWVQPKERAGTGRPVAPPRTHSPVRAKSAALILARNPFDSVTGALGAEPPDEASVNPQASDLSDPLAAPHCDGVELHIVTEAPEPRWSLAALKGPGETRPRLRRMGDEVASATSPGRASERPPHRRLP